MKLEKCQKLRLFKKRLKQDDERDYIDEADVLSVVSSEWSDVGRTTGRTSRTPLHLVKSPDNVRRAVPANVLPAQNGQRPSMIPRRPKSLTSSIHTVQVTYILA